MMNKHEEIIIFFINKCQGSEIGNKHLSKHGF